MHELALAGVGGCTVGQVKENLSYSEYMDWVSYVAKNGTLNTAKRLEQTLSLIAAMFANAMLKKQSGEPFGCDDFSVYAEPKKQKEITPASAFEMLSAMAKQNTK